MDRRLKLVLFLLALFVVLYLVAVNVYHVTASIVENKTAVVAPKQAPGQAQVGALPFAVGAVALAVLVLAMGIGYVGVVVAIAITIAVFQDLGVQGAEYIALAFALGAALSALRGARPLFGAPRSVSVLIAAVAAVAAAFSDMTPIVQGFYVIAHSLAGALVQIASPALGGQSNVFIAAIFLMILIRYVVKAVGSARDPLTVTIITLAAALLTIQVSTAVIQMTIAVFTQTYGTLGYAVLMLAAIVALADLFTAVEKASVDTLVWVAPLGVLAQAVFGIQVAPLIAALAGISAVAAAFTGSNRMLSTALVLAVAAASLV